MKKVMPYSGGILVLISILFTRYIVSKYGEGSRMIVITVVLLISIIGLAVIIYTKKYLVALGVLMLIVPLLIMTIGMYLDNMYISAVGFLLIFILIPIMLKIINKRNK